MLPEEMFHLRDRSDDGVICKSRLARARETFGSAIATERYAASTFKNGASMSGILSLRKRSARKRPTGCNATSSRPIPAPTVPAPSPCSRKA